MMASQPPSRGGPNGAGAHQQQYQHHPQLAAPRKYPSSSPPSAPLTAKQQRLRDHRQQTQWTSLPFPHRFGQWILTHLAELRDRYPTIKFDYNDLSPASNPDIDNPKRLVLTKHMDHHGTMAEYDQQRAIVESLMTSLLASPANWERPEILHWLEADFDTSGHNCRLYWAGVTDPELATKLPSILDAPPPYFYMASAARATQPLVNDGVERMLANLGLDPRDAAADSTHAMKLFSKTRVQVLAGAISKRNRSFVHAARPNGPATMKLKASLGLLVFSRFTMGGVVGDACGSGSTFKVAEAVAAINEKEMKGSFADAVPLAVEPSLVRFLTAAGFVVPDPRSATTKVVLSFRIPDSAPKALATNRRYKLTYVYYEATDEFVRHPGGAHKHARYDRVPLSQTASVPVPLDRVGSGETALPLAVRMDHYVSEPLPVSADAAFPAESSSASAAVAKAALITALATVSAIDHAMIEYLNDAAKGLLLAHTESDDPSLISHPLPQLPAILVDRVVDVSFRLKQTTTYRRGHWSVTCAKVAALATNATPPRSVPITSLLVVQFKHAWFEQIDLGQSALVIRYVKMFFDAVQTFARGVRQELDREWILGDI
ncbi:hypothetical protein BC828DRAFT_384180 [Blastocladiella britannica]|nr:hypothetical protein BC828DRAFT_384180 [Blastocladiella britannica]